MMDSRPSRGRGGTWRRGGRGGHDSDSGGGGGGGEHRGRGRGGHHHHRGRGKRDHYRGRGRGGGAHAAEFHHRDQDGQDQVDQEEDDTMQVFSRRKLESNWDRYEESERPEPQDDTPTQRGVDFNVLLQSAGDSITHFRFSEEKDWEMDSFAASQVSAVCVDLAALAQTLQQLPLHQRLHLEPELLQDSTPVELSTMTFAPKDEKPKTSAPAPLSAALQSLSTNSSKPPVVSNRASLSDSQVLPTATKSPQVEEEEEADEELDQLLGLQKPVSDSQPVAAAEEQTVVPEEACEEVKEVTEEKTEEVKDKDVKPASGRKEVTEEDLEDWLDSMIS